MKPLKWSLVVFLPALLAMGVTGCERKVTNETTVIVAPDRADIVGSDMCQPCHGEIHAEFVNSGHPYKLNKADEAQQAGYYPYSDLPASLNGFSWDQVSYVIGGFRWKARFIGLDGKIITLDAASKTQWNLPTEDAPDPEWVPYHPGEDKDYACGPCHMTAYSPVGNQDGLPGLIGTWALPGIQCEECHGGGKLHVEEPREFNMMIDRSNEACGKCHIRGSVSSIPASGGFIKHHEQWNEIFANKHSTLQCVDCHDPHKGLHEKNPDRAAAIRSKCETCHFSEASAYVNSSLPHKGLGVNCIECHMPKAAKSARAVGEYKGDVRSHLFAINTDSDAPMFNEDGSLAMGYLTLEYTCLQCHATKDKEWAANSAAGIHPTGGTDLPGTASYIGSEACGSCHPDTYDEFVLSGHPYKLNSAADAQQPGYYPYGDLPTTLNGFSWDQVSNVIGGFRWKARFIDLNGKIITLGADSKTQWNLPTEDAPEAEWVPYHPGEDKNYDCGPCHMTAYKSTGNQDGLPGMIGTWEFGGIQCEECHGPGEFHAAQPTAIPLKIERSNESCGKCHIRGSVSSIPASGGFIKHHEQWNELFASKHAALDCVDCHDPHKGLHEQNPDRAAAIKSKCESCHFQEAAAYVSSGQPHFAGGVDCIACHMPKAAKSARKISDYVGDVRSHLFGINTDPAAPMFSDDGSSAMGYLTLDFSCLGCHTDKDTEWASQNAHDVHPYAESTADKSTPDWLLIGAR